MDKIVGSGVVAALSGIGAYYASHSCDLVHAAYNQCWSQAVSPKGPFSTAPLQWFTNVLLTDGPRACRAEFKAYKDCTDSNFSGTLTVISIAAAAFALTALCAAKRRA